MKHEFTGKPLESAFDMMLEGNLKEAAEKFEEKHVEQEKQEKMFEGIGSTCEGVGAALRDKVKRDGKFKTAKDIEELKKIAPAPEAIQIRNKNLITPETDYMCIDAVEQFVLC